MLAILRAQAFNEGIPAGIPAERSGRPQDRIDHGPLPRRRDRGGAGAGPYVLVVLTQGLEETGSRRRSSPRSPARCTRCSARPPDVRTGLFRVERLVLEVCLREQRASTPTSTRPARTRCGPGARRRAGSRRRGSASRGSPAASSRAVAPRPPRRRSPAARPARPRRPRRPRAGRRGPRPRATGPRPSGRARGAARARHAASRGPGTPPRRARTPRRRGTRARPAGRPRPSTRSARYPSRMSLRRTSATERCRASRNRAPASRTCAGSSTSARCSRRSAGVGLRGRDVP